MYFDSENKNNFVNIDSVLKKNVLDTLLYVRGPAVFINGGGEPVEAVSQFM